MNVNTAKGRIALLKREHDVLVKSADLLSQIGKIAGSLHGTSELAATAVNASLEINRVLREVGRTVGEKDKAAPLFEQAADIEAETPITVGAGDVPFDITPAQKEISEKPVANEIGVL